MNARVGAAVPRVVFLVGETEESVAPLWRALECEAPTAELVLHKSVSEGGDEAAELGAVVVASHTLARRDRKAALRLARRAARVGYLTAEREAAILARPSAHVLVVTRERLAQACAAWAESAQHAEPLARAAAACGATATAALHALYNAGSVVHTLGGIVESWAHGRRDRHVKAMTRKRIEEAARKPRPRRKALSEKAKAKAAEAAAEAEKEMVSVKRSHALEASITSEAKRQRVESARKDLECGMWAPLNRDRRRRENRHIPLEGLVRDEDAPDEDGVSSAALARAEAWVESCGGFAFTCKEQATRVCLVTYLYSAYLRAAGGGGGGDDWAARVAALNVDAVRVDQETALCAALDGRVGHNRAACLAWYMSEPGLAREPSAVVATTFVRLCYAMDRAATTREPFHVAYAAVCDDPHLFIALSLCRDLHHAPVAIDWTHSTATRALDMRVVPCVRAAAPPEPSTPLECRELSRGGLTFALPLDVSPFAVRRGVPFPCAVVATADSVMLTVPSATHARTLTHGLTLLRDTAIMRNAAVSKKRYTDTQGCLQRLASALRAGVPAALRAAATLLGLDSNPLHARFAAPLDALARIDAVIDLFVRDLSRIHHLPDAAPNTHGAELADLLDYRSGVDCTPSHLFDVLASALTPCVSFVWAPLASPDALDHEHPHGRLMPPDSEIPGMPPASEKGDEVEREIYREQHRASMRAALDEVRRAPDGRVYFAHATVRAANDELHLRMLDQRLVDQTWEALYDVSCSVTRRPNGKGQMCDVKFAKSWPQDAAEEAEGRVPATLVGLLCLLYAGTNAGGHTANRRRAAFLYARCTVEPEAAPETITLEPNRYVGTLPVPEVRRVIKKGAPHQARDRAARVRRRAAALRDMCVNPGQGVRVFADAFPGCVEAALRWQSWWWGDSVEEEPAL